MAVLNLYVLLKKQQKKMYFERTAKKNCHMSDR